MRDTRDYPMEPPVTDEPPLGLENRLVAEFDYIVSEMTKYLGLDTLLGVDQ